MARGNTLSRIRPLHAELIADPSWEVIGRTPDRRTLYSETSKRSRGIPLFDEAGEAQFRKLREEIPDMRTLRKDPRYKALARGPHRQFALHPTTAEPLYPKNKVELFDLERTFYLESQGNGNVEKVFWRPPTQEEIERAEREGRINEMKDTLASAFVDADITPEMLIELIKGGESGVLGTDGAEEGDIEPNLFPEEGVEYPEQLSKGRYRLSNGEVFEGKKADAIVAESEVLQARADANAADAF